jgi:hypothetical protein
MTLQLFHEDGENTIYLKRKKWLEIDMMGKIGNCSG